MMNQIPAIAMNINRYDHSTSLTKTMRRDSIFYKLFQQFPPLLFQLLETPPPNPNEYRFDSVAVKEPKFEIDGVFLPATVDGVVYFCEVQFQTDEKLYERTFAESFLSFTVIAKDLATGKQ
jgi:predicted transposase YdaD